jgi:hypothetical protein
LGLKECILFLEKVYLLNFWGSSEAAMGGGAHCPFGVFFSPERRVRAAHGRAREAKTH